jgi:hypothetical protein
MQSNVANSRAERETEAEREHQRQLELQRQQYQTGREDLGYERDLGMAETRSEHELTLAGDRSAFEAQMAQDEQALDVWKTNADNESDEWQTAFGAFMRSTSGAAGTSRSLGKWNIEFKDGMDLETGEQKTLMYATNDSIPFALEQVGTRMIPANLSDEEKINSLGAWVDPKTGEPRPDIEAQAVKDLLAGLAEDKDLSQKFLDQFGYLPHAYYRAKAETSDNSTVQDFARSFSRDRGSPAFSYSGDMPRSTPDRMAGKDPLTSGGNLDPDKPSGQRLSEAAATTPAATTPPATTPAPVSTSEPETVSEIMIPPHPRRTTSPPGVRTPGDLLNPLTRRMGQGLLKAAEKYNTGEIRKP